MQPNVLLVVLDTARADAFEPYGASPGSTPTLADVARDGGYTPRAYATGSWTLPSHVSMFTGMLPRVTGLGQAPDGAYHSTRPRMEELAPTLLPTVLRKAGYRTAASSCNAWISPLGGWDLGFDDFTFVPSSRGHPASRRSRAYARWAYHSTLADVDDGARDVERVMGEWFRDWDGTQPFFWFVNVVECHSPYLPPAPYNDLSLLQRLLAVRDVHRYQSFLAVLQQNLTGTTASPASLARMRYLYARSIRLLDDWMGRLLDLLDHQGVLDDTVVVVTSDHGENFGEGGLLGHSMSLDERLIRVPFIVRGPVEAPTGGAWSTVGLPALLGGAIGLEGAPWEPFTVGDPVPAQFDPLAREGDPKLDELVERWQLDRSAIRRFTEAITAVTDGSCKLMQSGDHRWWHDLDRDPLELTRLAMQDAPSELVDALDDPALWEDDRDLQSALEGDVGDADPTDVAQLEEQMRLLGYL